jgi:hypothetical protein
MATFASIVLVMVHTNPSRERDVARQLLMLCNFLFIFGGILARRMGRIACEAILELAATPLAWRPGTVGMHFRCWIGCLIVIIASIWAVYFSFGTILGGAGMMLALIAVSDYMISTVNTIAGLATYAISVYHNARGSDWDVVDRHTYMVQLVGKGLQIGLTAFAMGWALKVGNCTTLRYKLNSRSLSEVRTCESFVDFGGGEYWAFPRYKSISRSL